MVKPSLSTITSKDLERTAFCVSRHLDVERDVVVPNDLSPEAGLVGRTARAESPFTILGLSYPCFVLA